MIGSSKAFWGAKWGYLIFLFNNAKKLDEMPKISIVMAVLNPQPRYLREALSSVLSQSMTDFEVIVVEDASYISGREVIRCFSDSRIRYFERPVRTTLVNQKNFGIEMSQGEYIAIFDGDDVMSADRLEKQTVVLDSNKEVDVLGSQVRVIDSDGIERGYRCFPRNHAEILKSMQLFVPFCHPSVTIRRDAINAVNGYRETGYPIEDYDLWSRLAFNGARFANCDEALINYRLHSGQIKARRTRKCLLGVLYVKRRYWLSRMDKRALFWFLLECFAVPMPQKLLYRLATKNLYSFGTRNSLLQEHRIGKSNNIT
ncbi:Putative glycosyltransferase EpsE [Pirellula sp. SH-Sr6A]|uniref:glycosyltransferase n=1 Tax=Pirellula sp. SH-Sr6A TaxID=1632865 RepID=UPI00078BDEA6|nr:glycosyltransferase [Pirellula sp. SH-Sr6A]AMV32146.1 Putative glycosyltransferase EpsE [Pirellula sp. SH-Sr6A]